MGGVAGARDRRRAAEAEGKPVELRFGCAEEKAAALAALAARPARRHRAARRAATR
eukprot:gene5815-13900_t